MSFLASPQAGGGHGSVPGSPLRQDALLAQQQGVTFHAFPSDPNLVASQQQQLQQAIAAATAAAATVPLHHHHNNGGGDPPHLQGRSSVPHSATMQTQLHQPRSPSPQPQVVQHQQHQQHAAATDAFQFVSAGGVAGLMGAAFGGGGALPTAFGLPGQGPLGGGGGGGGSGGLQSRLTGGAGGGAPAAGGRAVGGMSPHVAEFTDFGSYERKYGASLK